MRNGNILTCSLLPVDQIPWSWVEFPCGALLHLPVQGCWSQCLGEAGGIALLGLAGQKAKVGCPLPTPLDPPILPSGHGPGV